MSKSLTPYWNALRSSQGWRAIPGVAAEQCTLSHDPASGEYTRLTRFHPGADTEAMGVQRHSYPEEVFVVSGSLYDAQVGRWLQAGDYASRPPGEPHGPFRTDEGCVVLELSFPQRTCRSDDSPGGATGG